MKIDRSKLADLSEIVSSIAILITLVYLTIEISQNTNALNAQSRETVLTAAQAELQLLMENPHIVQNLSGSSPLTEEEQIEIDSMLGLTLRSREFSWLQYQDGTIDELQWNTEFAVLLSILDAPRTRLWWEKMGRFVFGEEFVEFIDLTMEEHPASNSTWKAAGSWSN
jgi:hypothetical protein